MISPEHTPQGDRVSRPELRHPSYCIRPFALAIAAALIAGNAAASMPIPVPPLANGLWYFSITFSVVIISLLMMSILHKIRSFTVQPVSNYWWKLMLGKGDRVSRPELRHSLYCIRPSALAVATALTAGNAVASIPMPVSPFANALWYSSITFSVVIISLLMMSTLHKIRSFTVQPVSNYWWKLMLGKGDRVSRPELRHSLYCIRPFALAVAAALIAGIAAASMPTPVPPLANALWYSSITFSVVIISLLMMSTLHKIRSFTVQPVSNYWWKLMLGIGTLASFTSLIYYMLYQPQPLVYGDATGYLDAAMRLRAGEIGLVPQMVHYYPIFLALFVPLHQPWWTPLAAVQVTQATLTALLGPLVFGVVRQLHGTRLAALAAAFVCWLYGPFYHAAGTPHMEAVYTFMLVAATWAMLRLRPGQAGQATLTGALTALALMVRGYYAWYLVILGGVLGGDRVLQAWRARRSWAATAGAYMLGLTAILCLWRLVVSLGTPAGMSLQPSPFVGWSFQGSNGWAYSTLGPVPWQQFLEHGALLHPIIEKFPSWFLFAWRPETIAQVVTNLVRLWSRPADIAAVGFPLEFGVELALHRGLVLLAVLGLPWTLAGDQRRRLLLVMPLFLSIIIPIYHVESRYNLPAMPFVIVLAVLTTEVTIYRWLGTIVRTAWVGWKSLRGGANWRIRFSSDIAWMMLPALLLISSTLTWFWWGSISRLLMLFPMLADEAAQRWATIGLLVSLGFITCALATAAAPAWVNRHTSRLLRLVLSCVVLGGVGGAVLVAQLHEPGWREWSACFNRDGDVAVQQFRLSESAGGGEPGILAIDVWQPAGDYRALVVQVNGQPIKRAGIPLSSDPAQFPVYPHPLHGGVRQLEQLRQWWLLPVPADILQLSNPAVVEIKVAGQSPGGALCLYGDYDTDETGPRLMPVLGSLPGELRVLYKAVYDGDDRLYVPVQLAGEPGSVVSVWHQEEGIMDDGPLSRRDLSPSPGLQRGQFRIRLQVDTALY